MAFTDQQVLQWFLDNPNASDAQIAQTAAAAQIPAEQLSRVTSVPVAEIQARVAAAAPSIQLPSTAPQAPTKTWDEAYSEYGNALRSGDVTAGTIKDLYGGLSSDFSSNIIKIKSEIDAQKQAGTADYWGAGNLASPDSAAWDAAFRLAEKGVGSLYDLKQVDGQTVNAKTGQPLEGFGNAYNYDLDYNLQFSPEGIPVLTASNQQSDWVSKWRPAAQVLGQIALGATGVGGMLGSSLGLTGTAANVAGGALLGGGTSALTGGNVLKGALLGGGGAYVSSLLNSGVTDPDLLQAAYDADVAGGMIGGDTGAGNGAWLGDTETLNAVDALNGAGNGAWLGDFDTINAVDALNGVNSVLTADQLAAVNGLGGADVAGGLTSDLANTAGLGGGFNLSGLTADQLAVIDALGGADVAGGLTSDVANTVGLGGGFDLSGLTADQLDVINGLGGADVAGGLTADAADTVGLGGGFDLSGLTADQLDVINGLGGADVAGGLTADAADTAGLGGGFTGNGSVLTGAGNGAWLGDTGDMVSGTGGLTTGGLTGLTTDQIVNLVKAGVSLAALSGAANAVGGGGGGGGAAMQTPTQGVPTNSPNYYNQLQQYYNAYLPQTPRDVVAPLQQWYEGSFGSTGTNTAISPQQAQTAMPPTPSGTVMPTAPTSVPMAASTGLFNTPMTAQQQVQNLLSNPNLSNLPPEAAAAISRAVSAPRSYNDVVASGGQNTVDVSSLSPEVQRAYDLYQQSMILGANSSEVRRAYERAGVNPTNPDAFFAGQGLLTGTPTQAALSQYAPLALDRFAKSGGGALTYTVDPSTLPSTYTAPTVPDISFNMDRYVQSINNNTKISDAAKQRLISEQAVKRGFNPSEFI